MQGSPDREGKPFSNFSRGAGSSQHSSLRLVDSNSQIMSVLTRIVALMLHFLVWPGRELEVGIAKTRTCTFSPVIEMWDGDREQCWWIKRADELSCLS